MERPVGILVSRERLVTETATHPYQAVLSSCLASVSRTAAHCPSKETLKTCVPKADATERYSVFRMGATTRNPLVAVPPPLLFRMAPCSVGQ